MVESSPIFGERRDGGTKMVLTPGSHSFFFFFQFNHIQPQFFHLVIARLNQSLTTLNISFTLRFIPNLWSQSRVGRRLFHDYIPTLLLKELLKKRLKYRNVLKKRISLSDFSDGIMCNLFTLLDVLSDFKMNIAGIILGIQY